jgi:hypothetical protein
MACEFVAKRMFSGRGEDHEPDTGTVHHAVCRSSEGCLTSSLCGVDANEIGAGWRVDDEDRVTCAKCLERLENPPVFTIDKVSSSVEDVESVDYRLYQDGEYCGYWCIRSNEQELDGRPLSWTISFLDQYRGCFCFLNCSRAECLIRKVARDWEEEIIYVRRSRLNYESERLFERLERAGVVQIIK